MSELESVNAFPPCPTCGEPLDPARAQYDDEGRLVCARCVAKRLVKTDVVARDAEHQSTKSLFVGSIGVLFLSIASFCVRHRLIFFLFPLLAIVGGTAIVMQARKTPDAREILGWKYGVSIVLAGLAACLGVLSLVVSLMFLE